jgi:hypothetical protein
MNNNIELLFLRHPKIDYISPPVCEVLFSSSAGPVIVLNPFTPQNFPTGLILGGVGGFLLSWNTYPGALCYSVYRSVNPNDAFGQYIIIAECIPNAFFDLSGEPAGYYRVSAITLDGETPLSLPILWRPVQCPGFAGPVVLNPVHAEIGDNVIIGPKPVTEGFGGGVITYEWRKNGIPYLDTTATTKNELHIDDADPTDDGQYSLQVGNEILGCEFIISEDVELTVQPLFDITWGVPFLRPGIPAATTQTTRHTRNTFGYTLVTPPGLTIIDPNLLWTGLQTYTGPAANCNLKMVVGGIVGAPIWTVIIKVDAVTVLTAGGGFPVAGTFNFPFSIPISVGAVISVQVSQIVAKSITFDGTLTKI